MNDMEVRGCRGCKNARSGDFHCKGILKCWDYDKWEDIGDIRGCSGCEHEKRDNFKCLKLLRCEDYDKWTDGKKPEE